MTTSWEQEAQALLRTLEDRVAQLGVVHTTRRRVLEALIDEVLWRIESAAEQEPDG